MLSTDTETAHSQPVSGLPGRSAQGYLSVLETSEQPWSFTREYRELSKTLCHPSEPWDLRISDLKSHESKIHFLLKLLSTSEKGL